MGLEKKKLLKGENSLSGDTVAGGGEDRITNLPDCLIHRILSFLLIKDTIRTSALSKRWNCIFTSNPTLHFGDLEDFDSELFMDIVDRVLHLHDMSKISKFHLWYCGDDHLIPSKVSLWISAAVKRNVENLDLTWAQEDWDPFRLPLSLFTCESLTTLKLDICFGMCLPRYMSCPRLKHIYLHRAAFSDEYNNEQLFSGCPVLEELILEECHWSHMTNIFISVPALKILKIWGVDASERWDNTYGLRDCGLKIDAPNLVSLSYKCDLAKEQVICSFRSLVDADLDFNFDKRVGDATRGVYMIGLGAAASRYFKALSHVKSLLLSDRVLRALSCAKDLKNHLPRFHHLKELNVEREASTDEALIALLQSAPNLESLVLDEYISLSRRFGCKKGVVKDKLNNDDDSLDLDMMTTGCLLLHLKSVDFKVISGKPREMSWMKLILKNAKVLQTMTLNFASCTHYPNAKSEEEFLAEVSSIFTASEDCEFQISLIDCPH